MNHKGQIGNKKTKYTGGAKEYEMNLAGWLFKINKAIKINWTIIQPKNYTCECKRHNTKKYKMIQLLQELKPAIVGITETHLKNDM